MIRIVNFAQGEFVMLGAFTTYFLYTKFGVPPLIGMLVAALADFEGTMLFVSHDRHFLAALSNRVLELTPEGIHQYGGGYTEYVARTGQEAPGLHPGG